MTRRFQPGAYVLDLERRNMPGSAVALRGSEAAAQTRRARQRAVTLPSLESDGDRAVTYCNGRLKVGDEIVRERHNG